MELFDPMIHWVQTLFDSHVLTVPWTADYFSAVVGVITGALFAVGRRLDIIGTVTLGLVAAFSGGIIRDLLLQDKGVYFMSCPDLILLCILACVFVFYFQGVFRHLSATVFFCDALSVGLFALAGASKCVSCGVGFILCIILGAITAVGGGAVRDICVGETPSLFKQTNFYGVAGLVSSAVYVSLAWVGFPLPAAGLLCVLSAVVLRYTSVYFDLKTSQPKDLTPKVVKGVKHVGREAWNVTTWVPDVMKAIVSMFLHGGDLETVAADVRNERKRRRRRRSARALVRAHQSKDAQDAGSSPAKVQAKGRAKGRARSSVDSGEPKKRQEPKVGKASKGARTGKPSKAARPKGEETDES